MARKPTPKPTPTPTANPEYTVFVDGEPTKVEDRYIVTLTDGTTHQVGDLYDIPGLLAVLSGIA